MATVADRILEHLSGVPSGLDDGQLAEALGARRQTVNQACRRLSEQGRLHRAPGAGGVIVNRLFNISPAANSAGSSAAAAAALAPQAAAAPDASELPDVVDASTAAETSATPEAGEVARPVESGGPDESAGSAAVPTTDAASVPQARVAADDADDDGADGTVEPDLTSEQTRIPAARPGEPEPALSAIPAARTSAADDAPAGVVVPPPVANPASDAEPASDVEPASDPVPASDLDPTDLDPTPVDSDAVVATEVPPSAEPASDVPPNDSGQPESGGSRPWWKRLLPWGIG